MRIMKHPKINWSDVEHRQEAEEIQKLYKYSWEETVREPD